MIGNWKTNKHYVIFADAVVVLQMAVMDVNEDSGSASICMESGVTEGFEAALTVSLIAHDGKASELYHSYPASYNSIKHYLLQ